jgi:hypothetical protein
MALRNHAYLAPNSKAPVLAQVRRVRHGRVHRVRHVHVRHVHHDRERAPPALHRCRGRGQRRDRRRRASPPLYFNNDCVSSN